MYILFTDTDVDLNLQTAAKYGYHMISMPYIIGEKTYKPYEDWQEFDYKSFYDLLRTGVVPKTCAISPAEYINYFEPYFKQGYDILYIHFSKAMSGTFNALELALEDLKEKYPDRQVRLIDTKGITTNSLISVITMGEMYKNGASMDEIEQWAKENVDHCATYFYCDDLKFFKASGRVTNLAAFMGSLFGVKPIIHMDANGTMTTFEKSKGRMGTLNRLVDIVDKLQDHIKDYPVIIGHSDSIELAEVLGQMLKDKFGSDLNIIYEVVNPTAGSHCGPNCVGVAFHAIHR